MAADVELRMTRSLAPEAEAVLRRLDGRGIARMQVSELVAMAAVPSGTQLVELKAVEPGYPFYGKLRAVPEDALATLFTDTRALAEEALLTGPLEATNRRRTNRSLAQAAATGGATHRKPIRPDLSQEDHLFRTQRARQGRDPRPLCSRSRPLPTRAVPQVCQAECATLRWIKGSSTIAEGKQNLFG